jgi:hypothetical protein
MGTKGSLLCIEFYPSAGWRYLRIRSVEGGGGEPGPSSADILCCKGVSRGSHEAQAQASAEFEEDNDGADDTGTAWNESSGA